MFQLLYRFFVIEHGRRKILHFNSSGIRRQIGWCNSRARLFRRRVLIAIGEAVVSSIRICHDVPNCSPEMRHHASRMPARDKLQSAMYFMRRMLLH